jgi:hypothetical protein
MSDTTDLRERLRARLEQVRVRLRDLELDATLVRGRTEEAREDEAALMEMLDDTPRRRPGRPRRVTTESELAAYGEARANPYPSQILQQSAHAAANPPVVQMPDRVAGGMAGAEAGLPSLDDVRGILKIPETAA